nr:energy transducer TonB [uncultured Pseudacidovorax sp.]
MNKLFAGLAVCAVLASGCASRSDAPKPSVIRWTPCSLRYPLEARQNGWQGSVVVNVKVEADGTASETSVTRSSGYDTLDREALQAVRCMRYQPASVDGVARAGWVDVPFRFVLPP